MNRNEFGVFELEIKGKNGKAVIPHGSKVKVKEFPCVFRNLPHFCLTRFDL
jgi:hypothetical protein